VHRSVFVLVNDSQFITGCVFRTCSYKQTDRYLFTYFTDILTDLLPYLLTYLIA